MLYYIQEEEKLLENKRAERRDKIKISLIACVIFGALITLGYTVVGVQITESKGWQSAVCNIERIDVSDVKFCLYKSNCVFLTFYGYANTTVGTVPFEEQESCYDLVTKCSGDYYIGEMVDCCYKGDVFRFGGAPSYDKLLLSITALFTPFFMFAFYYLIKSYKENN